MNRFRLCVLALSIICTLCAAPSFAAGDSPRSGRIGVVLLHGKRGSPDRHIADLAAALRAAGYRVATPEMPWSRRRLYDADHASAMREITAAAEALRREGAAAIVVAGHSMGANAALGYAAGHPGLLGLICLAPGHSPDRGRQRELVAPEVDRARALVAEGKADAAIRFTDVNSGRTFDTVLPAGVFLSYFDPEGPSAMPLSAARIAPALPVLWVVGKDDPLSRLGPGYVFERLPAHPASRYLELEGGHLDVPRAAVPAILDWLKGLPE
jgi:pimeloyl-ACP methyl ester carboxylesterase